MQMLRKYSKRWTLMFIAIVLMAPVAKAGKGGPGGPAVRAMAVLDGSQHQIKVDSSRTVEDSAFFNPSYIGDIDSSYTVQNVVSLGINEASSIYLRTAFTVTVRLRISYTSKTGDTASVIRDFTINYDSSTSYNARSSFVFNGAHKVTIKVLSVNTGGTTSWDPTTALVIENQLVTRPNFKFSCGTTVSGISVNPSSDPTADELPVSWTTVLGADQYDLEWAYIDRKALARYKTGGVYNPALIFLNNATRVTTTGTGYSIPLIYDDSGTLFIRVRPVQLVAANSVITAIWSSELSTPVMGEYDFTGHERPLNWQSNISFAEEGKRKVVVQYFDGSLRSRQTLTKDNTTNTTIVGETYYDYQGRPSIQVMPSPTLNNIIKYTASFNVSINGAAYSQSNYDTLAGPGDSCDLHADAMIDTSGASFYYSAHNPAATSGLNQFIPNANNYPFTETEYTPDNTGRISRQGGVGLYHQLGSGHETRYFYGTPDQDELDGLFGTEVGDRTHYFKNMVRDANGQYSVSYVDMHGRTIATALAGAAPSGMAALPSNTGSTVTETLSDTRTTLFQQQSMVSQKSLVVPVAGTYAFNYSLTPSIFQELNCKPEPVCYTCRYDLEITISDNCNNQLLRRGGKPFDTVLHNFKIDSITLACTAPAMSLNFSLDLPEGAYLVTKKLTPNHDAYNYYRDSVYLPGNTCTSLDQYINTQRMIAVAANTQCAPTCQACMDSVGTFSTFRARYIAQGGLEPADTAAYRTEIETAYNNALASCSVLCSNSISQDNDILSAMLQDMTPPFGQYADTTKLPGADKYSIFYIKPNTADYTPLYKLTAVDYQDENGRPDSVYNDRSGIMVEPNSLSVTQFTQNFRPSWAYALLPYHPEYCKLQALQAQRTSNLWDRSMEAVDTYAEANSKGLLNPTNISGLPFPADPGNLDPLSQESTALKNALNAKLNLYQKAQGTDPNLSMWALACVMVKCQTHTSSCLTFYTNINNDFNTTDMCAGDLDMAWRYFRQLYLDSKQDILTKMVLAKPAGCTPLDPAYSKVPTTEELFAAHHSPQFTDETNSIKHTPVQAVLNVSSPTSANGMQAAIEDSLRSFYSQNCASLVPQWARQLSVCGFYDSTALYGTILPRLLALSQLAVDADHPFGASTLPAGVTYNPAGTPFHSFQDIINNYNTTHGITDALHCNAENITFPMPYDRQPVYSAKPVYTRPSDCECKLIGDLYNTYLASGGVDATFSAFLKRTQQVTMTDADLLQLRTMCAGPAISASCTFVSQPIYLPPAMQCSSGPACATCTVVDSIYHAYLTQYPADTPSISRDADTAQVQKNLLFRNYMNNRLGFNKEAWEYMQFMDTCASHSGTITTDTQCIAKTIGQLFKTGTTDQLFDIRSAPGGGYILAGGTDAGGLGGRNAFIARTDSTGVILWSKAYGGANDDYFLRVRATSDGGFVAIGTTHSTSHVSDILAVKLSASGNTEWTKLIGLGTNKGELARDIIQMDDGGYAALAYHNFDPGHTLFMVTRLNDSGNIVWTRKFGCNTSNDPYSLTRSGDTIIVVGSVYDGSRYLGALYKLSPVSLDSGRILNAWSYKDSLNIHMSNHFSDIWVNASDYLLYVYCAEDFSIDSGRVAALRLSKTGTIQSYQRFDLPSGNFGDAFASTVAFTPTSDGGYLVGQTGSSTIKMDWQKFNASGTRQWSVRTNLPSDQLIGSAVQNPNGSFTIAGTDYNHALFLNLSDSAKTGCYDTAITLTTMNRLLTTTTFGMLDTNLLIVPSSIAWTLTEINLTPTDSAIACSGSGPCYPIYNGPLLCGKSAPILPPLGVDSITACTDSTFFSVSKGTELFKVYRDSLTGAFERGYLDSCMQAYKYESFTVTHVKNEYHYTLYYYDQAGNLIRTVSPSGVQQMSDPTWLSQVRDARAAGTVQVPSHTLATDYRYNTLNQVVAQHSPDGGTSHFWYDRLGRLVLSQNARQVLSEQYSYTKYDSIGRIVEVGQLVSSTPIADSISRKEDRLALWLSNAAPKASQFTVTVYDTAFSPIEPELVAKNLRNRVVRTALYDTATDRTNHRPASATYFSYDVLGNVDTLVQDYKKGVMAAHSNRFKKLVYDYDLVSGKVNKVSFQHGYADAFYHSYLYDAENRLTNAMSSMDSVNWDNEAFYRYYAHGPLSRSILGQQQVQGINYAYTLQGWLKAINPGIYTGGSFDLRPDSSGNIVAASAYNLLLNYFNGDYSPISGVAGPDSAVHTTLSTEYRPLYNGNISSMGVNVRGLNNPLLYNYQYDQLNRLVGMDAWNRTSTPWSSISKVSDFRENIAYDPNGNILQYKRNGNNTFASKPLGMDSLKYIYTAGTNRLDHIRDSVPGGNYTTDIDDQSAANYKYDSIGQLVSDAASGISAITWTVYGKIASITKSSDTTIYYTYDPAGNRISKSVVHGTDSTVTWYARDAQGNVLSVYTYGDPAVHGRDLTQTELHIYGSSRLGLWRTNTNVQMLAPPNTSSLDLLGSGDSLTFIRGNKLFELTNHLGNVLATISDKRFGHSTDDSTVVYYTPDLVSANDYYPFGMLQPARCYTKNGVGGYRYGFNGKEKDDEVKGEGNEIDYGMRVYDPRAGRFMSVDPLQGKYPELTPYQFASNRPIEAIDLDGLEAASTKAYFKKKRYGVDALKIQRVDAGYGNVQTQLFSLQAHGSSQEFTKFKDEFLNTPQKITTNKYASYAADKKQDPKTLTPGDAIEIVPKVWYVPVAPPVYVRVMDVQNTQNSFKLTFATLEGHPEAGYVTFSGAFDEKTGDLFFSVLTETRQVYGLGKVAPSRTVQQAQWEIVIGKARTALSKEKKDVIEKENIQEYKYDETKPMGKGKQIKNKTEAINE